VCFFNLFQCDLLCSTLILVLAPICMGVCKKEVVRKRARERLCVCERDCVCLCFNPCPCDLLRCTQMLVLAPICMKVCKKEIVSERARERLCARERVCVCVFLSFFPPRVVCFAVHG